MNSYSVCMLKPATLPPDGSAASPARLAFLQRLEARAIRPAARDYYVRWAEAWTKAHGQRSTDTTTAFFDALGRFCLRDRANLRPVVRPLHPLLSDQTPADATGGRHLRHPPCDETPWCRRAKPTRHFLNARGIPESTDFPNILLGKASAAG
jgi:hypothetical protein